MIKTRRIRWKEHVACRDGKAKISGNSVANEIYIKNEHITFRKIISTVFNVIEKVVP
jgi:hypothetical protein